MGEVAEKDGYKTIIGFYWGLTMDMLYRKLGRTGIKCSVFSLGTWINFGKNSDVDTVTALVQCAYSQGINLFDTAEIYGGGTGEEVLGLALSQLKLPRDTYLLCSKVFWGGPSQTSSGLHRKHIFEGCEKTLKRLKVDYLDFYLCHRPDYDTPVIETILAMNILIQQGKIFFWGTSEWPQEKILEAHYCAKQNNLIGPSIEQFSYNMLNRKKGEVDQQILEEHTGIAAISTMPLACGILTGKYSGGIIPDNSRARLKGQNLFAKYLASKKGREEIEIADKLVLLADKLEIKTSQFILAWLLQNTRISSIILGASNPKQLVENIEATGKIGLFTKSINSTVESILKNKPNSCVRNTIAYNDVIKYG